MKRFVMMCAALAALAAAPLVISAGAIGSPLRVTVGARAEIPLGANRIGAVAATARETGMVVMRPRDESALQQLIAAVTSKRSPLFHHYLAPGQFAGRFGPTKATFDAIKAQLSRDGLRVTGVARDGLLVNFTGSAAAVERAFGTGLSRYRLADGSIGQATTSAITLPSSVAGSVAAVVGLDNLVHAHPAFTRGPASARGHFPRAVRGNFPHPPGSPTPCRDARNAAITMGGLTDDQIANAYGAFGLYGAADLGAGQHIAVYELESFARSDVNTFDTCFFGATAAGQMAGRLSVIPVDGGLPAGPGNGEAALDVQDVSGMAPGANIDVYTAPNTTFGGIDEYAAIVNADRDQIVTSSWGLCEQAVQLGEPGIQQTESLLFQQAAAQGQSVFVAAGDTGSDDCNAFRNPVPPADQNPVSVDDPGSQPNAVSVGGTTIDNAATQPPQEHVWNDGANWGAGGGGLSQSWAMPSWQQSALGPGMPLPGGSDYSNANAVEQRFGYAQNFCQSAISGASASTPCRATPDVSAQADEFTGAVTIFMAPFGWFTIGGTSSAAPIWAGLLALVNSSPSCAAHLATAKGVGFVNPLLYGVASNPAADQASFNDITSGNNDNYGLNNGLVFPARTGYDLATGLGTPRLTDAGGSPGLAYYLCSYAAAATRPGVTGLSPNSGTTAGGEKITITGTRFKSGSASNVASIDVGTRQLSATSFTVSSATSITATLPAARTTLPPGSPAPHDGAGPANVIVTLKDGESSRPSPKATFEYVDEHLGSPKPSVTGVGPYGGSEVAPAAVKIFGSGFKGVTQVTFGKVQAASFKVNSAYEITARPPRFSALETRCSPLPKTGVYAGENAANDICQVQVMVTSAGGTSATGKILPPLEGPMSFSSEGVIAPPPGCGCEASPAPSEYDYIPTPKITSVSSSSGPGSLASEKGGTVITVKGAGLNVLTLDYTTVGDPTQDSSIFFGPVFETGTQIQLTVPAQAPTTDVATFPFGVRTLAGQSAPATLSYAGVPNVTGVVNVSNGKLLNGAPGAADTGGTPLQLSGQGFAGQVLGVRFVDELSPFSSGTQYTFTASSDTSLSTQTVAQNPAIVDVELCTVTGCSATPSTDTMYLYPPGDPKVDSISPNKGPAAGGTKTVVGGENLGCPLSVAFGSVAAATFSPQQSFLDCGLTVQLNATSPAGTAGTTVPVTVTTVESYFTGSGPSTSTAKFKYTP